MAKRRYMHPYVDGQLVVDMEHGETYVFMDRVDGFRAQHFPQHFRPATKEEQEAFSQRKDAFAETRNSEQG